MIKKKVLGLFTALCLILTLSSATVFASSTDSNGNNGLSTTIPENPLKDSGGISTNSTDMPSKSYVYTNAVANTVSGSASASNLYTNSNFNGVDSISFYITNYSSSTLTITLHKWWFVGAPTVGNSITIAPGTTKYSHFDNLNSGEYYFLKFSAPSNFSGTVTENVPGDGM